MSRAHTRREALALLGGGLVWAAGGCGTEPRPGSTLVRSLVDPDGDALLQSGPGMPLLDRDDLGGGGRPQRVLARIAQLADVHVRDAQSPARVPFLDRLGPRLGSAFRPHELLTAQLLAAAVASVNDWGEADAVLVSGDLIDSAQRNELDWALTLLGGGTVVPDSGARGYSGVQAASNPDPLYYRPGLDAPRNPDLIRRALRPVRSRGLRACWWPVLGNHDILVQGELAPSDETIAFAVGDRLVTAPDADLERRAERGLLDRSRVDAFLRAGVPGDALRVSPDAGRVHLSADEVLARLRSASPVLRARARAGSTTPSRRVPTCRWSCWTWCAGRRGRTESSRSPRSRFWPRRSRRPGSVTSSWPPISRSMPRRAPR